MLFRKHKISFDEIFTDNYFVLDNTKIMNKRIRAERQPMNSEASHTFAVHNRIIPSIDLNIQETLLNINNIWLLLCKQLIFEKWPNYRLKAMIKVNTATDFYVRIS
ncbi:hypothetical protein DMA11_16285 [Marinilabiliaceae bacterium JC017]|nr:hypothetical protein DMA11_16285 [Marinilabiliaceae bacterium JC017]